MSERALTIGGGRRITAPIRARALRVLTDADLTMPVTADDLREEFDLMPPRPRTRGECSSGPRPCPWVSCHHHLYLDVNPESGSIKINHPHLDPWELNNTCALDVADRAGITLEEVGEIMNLTRERIRQVEVRGLLKLKMASPSPEEIGRDLLAVFTKKRARRVLRYSPISIRTRVRDELAKVEWANADQVSLAIHEDRRKTLSALSNLLFREEAYRRRTSSGEVQWALRGRVDSPPPEVALIDRISEALQSHRDWRTAQEVASDLGANLSVVRHAIRILARRGSAERGTVRGPGRSTRTQWRWAVG
jgi:hypothetical protein